MDVRAQNSTWKRWLIHFNLIFSSQENISFLNFIPIESNFIIDVKKIFFSINVMFKHSYEFKHKSLETFKKYFYYKKKTNVHLNIML